jgi:hypothetical protein
MAAAAGAGAARAARAAGRGAVLLLLAACLAARAAGAAKGAPKGALAGNAVGACACAYGYSSDACAIGIQETCAGSSTAGAGKQAFCRAITSPAQLTSNPNATTVVATYLGAACFPLAALAPKDTWCSCLAVRRGGGLWGRGEARHGTAWPGGGSQGCGNRAAGIASNEGV